ncbi:MAG: helix-turn-helix transcriptional regulator [Burkholderiaceae bacterium]
MPRPVAAMPKAFADGHTIAWHRHERHQLLFATSGVMSIATVDASWVVPTERALWLPAGIEHRVTMSGPVQMRTLYLGETAGASMPAACTVIGVTPLLRELIVRATRLPVLYDEGGAAGRLMQVLLDELYAMPSLPLRLPLPADPGLRELCRRILQEPARDDTLERWADTQGVSGRTLARRFRAQTGMSFGQWRQQARLLEALRRLGRGQSVTAAALDVGYESASAFSAMFKRSLGLGPVDYLGRQSRPAD